jgi:membrane protein implicated in regulation of membrane protease activity
MIIMLVVMLLPVIALPVFWLFPFGQALPIYVFCLLLSGSMFLMMRKNMKRPVATGSESMIGKRVEVIFRSASDKATPYRVRIEGEIWSASSRDSLEAGEAATITAVRGNSLIIERDDEKDRQE